MAEAVVPSAPEPGREDEAGSKAEAPPAAAPEQSAGDQAEAQAGASAPSAPAPGGDGKAEAGAAGGALREVALPSGWEGLSITLEDNKCIVSEVPKACFSSSAFAASGALKNQVEGVEEGDEVVTFNGETPARLLERITTAGDPWNACTAVEPSHSVGSKTKFDTPPCAACDFIRRRKSLGFDVALQMWLRAVKREIKFTLGVRSGGPTQGETPESLALAAALSTDVGPAKTAADKGSVSNSDKGTSSVVALKASSESVSRMEEAMARLAKLSALDDVAREKAKKQQKKGKGKGKGKKGKRPTGPNLPRTRLSEQLVTGEVVEWKGKYGWIKPHYPVDHPKASLHKGRLYLHLQDVLYCTTRLPQLGSECRFHVYCDANSLGAEEATVLAEERDCREANGSNGPLHQEESDWHWDASSSGGGYGAGGRDRSRSR